METQNRLMFPLAALLLGLVAVVVLAQPGKDDADAGDDNPGTQTKDTEHWARLLPGLEAGTVQKLELTQGDEVRTFVHEEDGWRITTPLQADADDDRVEGLVNAFASAEGGETIPGAPKDFGLAPPVAKVVLTGPDGSSHELDIGDDAPVGWHSYVRLGPDGPVQATRAKLSSSLGTSLAELRVRTLWSIPRTAVDAVSVRGPAVALDLEQRDGDWWVRAALAGPDGSPPVLDGPAVRADADHVAQLLGRLSSLEATGFLDEAPAMETDLPWSVHVTAAGAMQTLTAGQSASGTWLGTGPRQPGLVTLPDDWAQVLVQPVTSWWASDLVPVDEDALASLTVQLGEHRLEATHSVAGWSPDQARKTVDALTAVRVDRSPAPAPEGSPWGRVVLSPSQGSVRELDIYQELPDGSRVVVDQAGGPPFRLSALELGRIDGALPGSQG